MRIYLFERRKDIEVMDASKVFSSPGPFNSTSK